MLYFNPNRMFELRGIDRAHAALVKAGIAPATATKLLNYHSDRLTVAHIGIICELLNCTPNDLFFYKPSEKKPLADNHALNALIRTTKPARLSEIIKDIPADKLSQLENILQDLKNQE